MSKITFAEDAWEEYLYWQAQDLSLLVAGDRSIKYSVFIISDGFPPISYGILWSGCNNRFGYSSP